MLRSIFSNYECDDGCVRNGIFSNFGENCDDLDTDTVN